MPELNLVAQNSAPAASTSARGRDAGALQDDAGATPFGDLMANATANATAKGKPAAKRVTAKGGETQDALLSKPGSRKDKTKADPALKAKDAKPAEKDPPKLELVLPVAGEDATTKPTPPAKSALEHVANVLATIATPAPAAAALAHAAVTCPVPAEVDPDSEAYIDGVPVTSDASGRARTADAIDTSRATHHARLQVNSQLNSQIATQSDPQTDPQTDPQRDPQTDLQSDLQSDPQISQIDPPQARTNEPAFSPAHRGAPDVNIHESRSPEARAHVDARRAPAINESAAIQRDRLIEDFQQRFERALASPASTPPSPQAAGAASEAGLLHASAASAWAAAAPQPAQPNNVAYINVPATVGTPAFAEDFSQRVVLLTRGKVHSAELSLTPAELGPVSVSIEVRGTEATLVFGSAHAATRAAIEEALPRLREMLSAQGLELTDARVGTQTGDGSPRDADHSRRQSAQLRREEIAPGGSTAAATPLGTSIVRSTRLIDVIA